MFLHCNARDCEATNFALCSAPLTCLSCVFLLFLLCTPPTLGLFHNQPYIVHAKLFHNRAVMRCILQSSAQVALGSSQHGCRK